MSLAITDSLFGLQVSISDYDKDSESYITSRLGTGGREEFVTGVTTVAREVQ